MKQADGRQGSVNSTSSTRAGGDLGGQCACGVPHVLAQLAVPGGTFAVGRCRPMTRDGVETQTMDVCGAAVEFPVNNLVGDTVDALSAEGRGYRGRCCDRWDLPEPEQAASSEEGQPEIVLDEPAPVDDSSESEQWLRQWSFRKAAENCRANGRGDAGVIWPQRRRARWSWMAAAGVAPATAAQADASLAVLAQQVMALMIDGSGALAAGQGGGAPSWGHAHHRGDPGGDCRPAPLESGIRAEMKQHFGAQAALWKRPDAEGAQTAVRAWCQRRRQARARRGRDPAMQSVPRLSHGRRGAPVPHPTCAACDVYLWMTEDYEWRAATTGWNVKRWGGDLGRRLGGQPAQPLVNSPNRAMIEIFNDMSQYRWYEPLVSVVPHDGSAHHRPHHLERGAGSAHGRRGRALPRGAAGDSREQMMFQKRHVDRADARDDPHERPGARAVRCRAAHACRHALLRVRPRWQHLDAEWRRGPALSDGKALFHLDHANLGTAAFAQRLVGRAPAPSSRRTRFRQAAGPCPSICSSRSTCSRRR